ncbi:MAG TPA: hypothetical protein ENN67_00510, partial [Firmicutes bacterium]|nr:hypothetical protein [Bacillota bacterium]
MRISSSLLTLVAVFILLAMVGSPATAEQGRTRGYDLEFANFLRSQGEKLSVSVVSVESRFTRMIHENGQQREIYLSGSFASGFVYNDQGIVVTDFRLVQHPPSTYY